MHLFRYSFAYFVIAISSSGCSINFNNIAADGQASDVLEESQTADPKLDAVLSIPAPLL